MGDNEFSNLLPRTVKIDLDTPLESAWTALASVSGVVCFFILQLGFIGSKHTPPDPAMLRYLPYAIGAVGIFLVLKRLTDNYYLVDRQRKAIFYHFECVVMRSTSEFLRFSVIDSVVVNGSIHHSKHSRWYEYQIQLVEKNGTRHNFSDSLKDGELDLLNSRAETISKIIECRLFPGKSEQTYTISSDGSSQVFVSPLHAPLNNDSMALSNMQISGKAFAIVILLALAFFGMIFAAVMK